ncbi:MAG: phenylalanine 4-monooxygenase [Burkholderiales bacterium]|nr:phenylalanine 4-monooxygenase [Burkholderiales bacterium]
MPRLTPHNDKENPRNKKYFERYLSMVVSRYTAHEPDQNGYIPYTNEENKVWSILFDRQTEIIKDRAMNTHLIAAKAIGITRDKIPQPKDISYNLRALTGWSVTPVPALIDFDIFFDLLSKRVFPAASFIRRMEDLDYLQEPDIFHEIFGHCPMLTQQFFADFTQEIGNFGKALNRSDQIMLARLYWFTVEFGLINSHEGLRIYGAGILSSKTESVYALDSKIPLRKKFNLIEVLRTPYRYDEMQKVYFVINNYEELFNLVHDNLKESFDEARKLGMLSNLYANAQITEHDDYIC